MNPTEAARHWHDPATALRYARAAVQVGLWESERLLAGRHLPKEAPVLELGCGAGRVALGLWREGWREVVPTDLSPEMVGLAEGVLSEAGCPFKPRVADATTLPFPDRAFAGAIFAFNGLMCIPGRARRAKALAEIRRVLLPGAPLLLTAHDRLTGPNRAHWLAAAAPPGGELGDRWHETDSGPVFIHASTEAECRGELEAAGFAVALSAMRSELAEEPPAVRAFSDDTRWFVALA
jgi:SAM-dependent methyltransferase